MSAVTVPAADAVNFHHTVLPSGLPLPAEQDGVGSVASVVAAKLSTMPVNEDVVICVAFAKLSFEGGVESFTVKNTGAAEPLVGGGFVAPIRNCPPNCRSEWLIVALICVPAAFTEFVVIPFELPSIVAAAFGAKFAPIIVIARSVAPFGPSAVVEFGATLVITGPLPMMLNGNAFVVLGFSVESCT